MAKPTTRTELKEYALRRLGDGAICVNITDAQAEDRIDDALCMYHDFHYDGMQRVLIAHPLTQTDIDNGYISVSDDVTGVVRVFPYTLHTFAGDILFDVRYNMIFDTLVQNPPSTMQWYTMTREHIAMIDEILVGQVPIRYRRHTDRVYIDQDWDRFSVGDYILIDAWQIIDPATYPQVWSDKWLIAYTTALFKVQWGSNLIKFDGVQGPGGVTLNGERISSEALEEKLRLEEQLRDWYEEPPPMFMG